MTEGPSSARDYSTGVSTPWTDWHWLSHHGNQAGPIDSAIDSKPIAVACHPDGRMHAVMFGRDCQVWHNEQVSAGVSAAWTDWHELSHPGNAAVAIAIASHPDGRMHAVMAGLEHQLWHNEQESSWVNAAWTDWHELSHPGNKARIVALASHPDGRMHAVMTGVDDQVWHNEQVSAEVSAPWTDWRELTQPGNLAVGAAIASHPDGRMHAVLIGADHQVWHTEQDSGDIRASWIDWRELSHPGNKAKVTALACHPDGRMHSVLIGLDSQVWHVEQTAAGVSAPWTDWRELSHPGNNGWDITLACHPDGRMHAVMTGTDVQAWHNEQTSAGSSAAWTDWYELSHPGDKSRHVVMGVHPDGRMHAVCTNPLGNDGSDFGQIWHNEQRAGQYS